VSLNDSRLLLVDDDPTVIQMMGRMLAQYPNQRFATSGEAALRLAREAPPDLILLDANMPGMSGYEVCSALKADAALAHVPIIFVTSHNAPEREVEALSRGAVDFVAKPLAALQLTARVRTHLRAAQRAEHLDREWVAAGSEPAAPGSETPRLLIVDDDVIAIRVLRNTLDNVGDFFFAKTGEEALSLAQTVSPHLVLLDADMPGVDGFAVCSVLKAQAAFEHVPIVFVTRFADPRNEMRALDLGAADFIAKPFAPTVLAARVRNLLKSKRRADVELHAVRAHWRKVGDARVADIVESASDAIVSCDYEGRTVLANAAACHLFDTPHEQLIGRPLSALLGADFLETARGCTAPLQMALPAGREPGLVVEAGISVIGDGRYGLTTVTLRDVSVRERLAAESAARIEAEATSRAKSQMLSFIAHEMGNPLNGLLGFAQLMQLDPAHPLPAVQAARLERVVAAGRHLQELMRDVMDLGAFEAGKLRIRLQPVDAAASIGAAVASVAALAEQAGVAVEATAAAPAQLVADADRLQQCLVNLLSNAIKYSPTGGRVEIGISAQGSEVGIAVRDNGIGMDAVQLEQLFEPFNRLGRAGGIVPGAGLGLAITRQLVEAMQGRLRVESTPGAGSRFEIRLPRAAPAL
jgi:signal transduction histidine kinase